ncbi:hypothetical protein FT643_04115 [Ketobacter sp. MCCC 1A13808]|uniref:hypothetical protein n=1 Tax=Ketobacter sp. MCCC 1A13808 TaxID=2602738 RepID=UPI000F282512|nr:hypothetical protein [Ketobacter sp. MCCC 1A13808]MVF11323.1 hypothetical protein [Ketobacter sp. MCCC 1A13808]RLP54733.1 MAG: hypothetical protein D6160_10030 [Ketobacter sp.]
MFRFQSILFLIATLILAVALTSSVIIARNHSMAQINIDTTNFVTVPFNPANNPAINGSFNELAKIWSLTEMLNDVRVPYTVAATQPAFDMILVGSVPAVVDTASLKRDSLEDYVFQIAAPAPDPTSIALLALGLIFLGIARRTARRRKPSAQLSGPEPSI